MVSCPCGAPPPSEQLWREEVLYLHSLWHKGHPRNPNRKPNSNNLGASNSSAPKPNSEDLCDSSSSTPKPNSENLGVSNTTTFKRSKNKQRGTKKMNNPKPIFLEIEWPSGSDPGWCKEIVWPESNPESDQATRPAAAEGQPKSNNLDASNSSTPKSNSENLGPSSSSTSQPNSENLGVSNPITFKKRRKNKRRGAKKKKDSKPIVSELECLCGSDGELRLETGWPESNPQSDQATRPPTAEDQAKSTSLYLQKKDRILFFKHHHFKALMGSYPFGAAPPSEQLWREEVLYLHSLWHKGPPQNPNPKPNSYNLGASNPSAPKPNSENLCDSSSSTPKPNSENLGVSNPTTFKKRRKNKQRGTKKMNNLKPICSEVEWPCGSDPGGCQEIGRHESNPESDQATRPAAAEGHAKPNNLDASNSSTPEPISENFGPSSSLTPKPNSENLSASNPTAFKKGKNKRRGAKKKKDPKPIVAEFECPCGSDPETHQETGWPESNPQSDQATRSPTAEEQARSTALYLQQKGLQACQGFFSSKVCTDDNEVEEDMMVDDINESEEFKFFMGIFTDNSYLKDYYEKNWESGEFCCLVCGGTGKTLLKKFKNCFALVQHSTTISKTKRKVAHRAFGRAICKVLGWETHQRRSIGLSLDGPPGHSMAKAESEVGFHQNIAQKEELRDNFIDLVDDSDGEVDPKDHGVIVQKEDLRGKVIESVTVVKGEQIRSLTSDAFHVLKCCSLQVDPKQDNALLRGDLDCENC